MEFVAIKVWDDENLPSVTQTNPSHVANLLRYRKLLKLRLLGIGGKKSYRPSPTKVKTALRCVVRNIDSANSVFYNALCHFLVMPDLLILIIDNEEGTGRQLQLT